MGLSKKQSSAAFMEEFRKYEADLYRIAYVHVKNEQDALDIMQETAYRAYKNQHTLKQPQYFKTWLTRIVINCAIDHIRKSGSVLPLDDYAENLPELSHQEEQQIILRTTLHQLMDDLSPTEKNVVLLKYYQNLTIREIAEICDMPIGSVKTVLYRALHKLRTKLQEEESK